MNDRHWMHTYTDFLLDELDEKGGMSKERLAVWLRAITSAAEFMVLTKTKKRGLPEGCVQLDDPRWRVPEAYEVVYAAAAAA